MNQDQFIRLALGDHPQAFQINTEDATTTAWFTEAWAGPADVASKIESVVQTRVRPLLGDAHSVDVRLFLGSRYPLLVKNREEGGMVLYAIPSLPVAELAILFEAGQKLLQMSDYDTFLRLRAPYFPEDLDKPPLDRETYNEYVLGGKVPWKRVHKALNRINNRYPLEIVSISPDHIAIQLIGKPVNEKDAKWCANIVLKANPEAADVVAAPKELWEGILESGAFNFWWD